MRDLLYPEGAEPSEDPIAKARRSLQQRPLPKRFYSAAATARTEAGHEIRLDGKTARTPARNVLALPTLQAAELVAQEFAGMVEVIDPAQMPITRIANSAIDGVAQRMQDVRDEIIAYASSDLVCFRAETPAELQARQAKCWDPVITWARASLAARFVLTAGVMPIRQDAEAIKAVSYRVANITDPCALAALNVMTTISGSALIALMALDGGIGAADAWASATVDDRWNAEQWGEDAEALEHLRRRERDFTAAHALLHAVLG